jgi:DNA-binding protein HU-beta
MNKSELVETVASDVELSKADVARAVDSLLGTVEQTLRRGEDVSITGFGKFSVGNRAARAGRNPQTGETVRIKASKTPRFSAGASLKQAVNDGHLN